MMNHMQNTMRKFQLNLLRILTDLLVLCLAFFLAYAARLEFALDYEWLKRIMFAAPYVLGFEYFLMFASGATRGAWRYIGMRDALKLTLSLGIASIALIAVRIFAGLYIVELPVLRYVLIPYSVILMNFGFAVLGTISLRSLRRLLREHKKRIASDKLLKIAQKPRVKTILIGAGEAGVQVLKSIELSPALGIELVGFIDDDPSKQGRNISGLRVLGQSKNLGDICQQYEVEQGIITIANIRGADLRNIVESCQDVGLPVKIVPKIDDLIEGKIPLSAIREVSVEDLLHRESVQLDREGISQFIRGRRVLVSGAGGSIGSELCRQVLAFGPEKLVLLERSEFFLYKLDKELSAHPHGAARVPILADINHKERLDSVFDEYKPELIFHAAAYKHVPMLEKNPGEAIHNNILGTKQIADCALAHNCEVFVMVSTDKAVNPSSIMGGSKRVAELYIQSLTSLGKTKFLAVRFGNVLGSTGSVVPLFKEQIAKGGPITVTHPEMMRYFMTIPEASQLVLQAATMGKGGEIFVLDMGEPVKIVDLAKDIIRLSGKDEDEIEIQFMGCRPGEKLFEELGFDAECMEKTKHDKIYIGKLSPMAHDALEAGIEKLLPLRESTDATLVREAFQDLVPELQAISYES
ncbi:MAG: nucleoside-diphosphate sugar epimerase/dehydratase [Bradymonadales bacterium]